MLRETVPKSEVHACVFPVGLVSPDAATKPALNPDGVMIAQFNGAASGQTVYHLHFHIIPRPGPHEGLGLNWSARSLDKNEAAELVKLITAGLQKAP